MDYINVKGRTKNDGYRFLDESENRPLTHLGAFFGGVFGGWGGSTITGYGVDQLYQNR